MYPQASHRCHAYLETCNLVNLIRTHALGQIDFLRVLARDGGSNVSPPVIHDHVEVITLECNEAIIDVKSGAAPSIGSLPQDA